MIWLEKGHSVDGVGGSGFGTIMAGHWDDLIWQREMADVGVSTTDICQLHSRPHQPTQGRPVSWDVKLVGANHHQRFIVAIRHLKLKLAGKYLAA